MQPYLHYLNVAVGMYTRFCKNIIYKDNIFITLTYSADISQKNFKKREEKHLSIL